LLSRPPRGKAIPWTSKDAILCGQIRHGLLVPRSSQPTSAASITRSEKMSTTAGEFISSTEFHSPETI
jgi:hypothetical protein